LVNRCAIEKKDGFEVIFGILLEKIGQKGRALE